MSGHSKWAQIKHKKAHTDVKRGKLFSKIVKEIAVAARLGGGDPGSNPRLRLSMDKAKEANMPYDNIKRAIMKGTGELPGSSYEEAVYEGYGPGGVAIYIEALTDNKKRTVSELRHLMSKNGGNMGEAGCVAWMFYKCGYILVDKKAVDEDSLMSVALEAGAQDMKNDPQEDNYEIITAPEDMHSVQEAIKAKGTPVALAEVTMLAKSYVDLEERAAEQMTRLMEALEEHEDVQNVYANFNIPEEMMAKEKLS
jgi:YebC/PmpR family DNA-binding regulatory protein